MYERPLRPGEVYLAHHGVKGMHWGQRKLRKLSSKNASDMRKVYRIKSKMAGRKEHFIDPVRWRREARLSRLNKRIKKRNTKFQEISMSLADQYRKRGEEIYSKHLDKELKKQLRKVR